MRALYFLGTSLDDLRDFPTDPRQEAGYELRRVQSGLDPRDWKPMSTVGAGVREIRIPTADGAFRVLNVVEREDAVYVLHAFQKKTERTSRQDIERGRARYRMIR